MSLLDLNSRSFSEYLSKINLENLLTFSGDSSKEEIFISYSTHCANFW